MQHLLLKKMIQSCWLMFQRCWLMLQAQLRAVLTIHWSEVVVNGWSGTWRFTRWEMCATQVSRRCHCQLLLLYKPQNYLIMISRAAVWKSKCSLLIYRSSSFVLVTKMMDQKTNICHPRESLLGQSLEPKLLPHIRKLLLCVRTLDPHNGTTTPKWHWNMTFCWHTNYTKTYGSKLKQHKDWTQLLLYCTNI